MVDDDVNAEPTSVHPLGAVIVGGGDARTEIIPISTSPSTVPVGFDTEIMVPLVGVTLACEA